MLSILYCIVYCTTVSDPFHIKSTTLFLSVDKIKPVPVEWEIQTGNSTPEGMQLVNKQIFFGALKLSLVCLVSYVKTH